MLLTKDKHTPVVYSHVLSYHNQGTSRRSPRRLPCPACLHHHRCYHPPSPWARAASPGSRTRDPSPPPSHLDCWCPRQRRSGDKYFFWLVYYCKPKVFFKSNFFSSVAPWYIINTSGFWRLSGELLNFLVQAKNSDHQHLYLQEKRGGPFCLLYPVSMKHQFKKLE